jgi:phosphoglycerol transferase MdoB-like AlkP superfamily enzyme
MFYNFVQLNNSAGLKVFIRQFFLLVFFWLLLFIVARIIFYLGISFLLENISFSLILESFPRALRLDLSMIGYLLLLPALLGFFYLLLPRKPVLRVIDWINYLLIILYSATAIGEMCLYREWKAKLSMQALSHFSNPKEVFGSASLALTALFFGGTIFFSWFFIRLYKRRVSLSGRLPENSNIAGKFRWRAPVFLVSSVLICGIAIRGGWQQIPIQSSDAFFCLEPTVNDAAVNPLWNITYNIIDYENHFKTNQYKDFSQEEADRISREMFEVKSDSTVSILTNNDPNIVFILLESWSAWCVKSFGGDDFAPFTDSLSRQGIRFRKFYPAGYVSDQGIPGVLSSYPSTSRISVINQSSKSAKLSCINRDLEKYGYQSGFIFGGDLNYGNIRSYIYNQKFGTVKEERDFSSDLRRGKLGIQDMDMAVEYLNELNKARQPFVYAWFTLSSHMPYDFPGEKKKLTEFENDYANSITYSDGALRKFFEGAKKQDWYKNTLFVLVADHSHGTHKQFSVYDHEYHRIPFYLFGDVIRQEWRGREMDGVFSHTDIVPSLLMQMGKKNERKQYTWGKDVFNPDVRSFAYYCNFSGAGMVTKEGFIAYQHDVKELLFNGFGAGNSAADSITRLSKAFQQSVYEDYRLK